MTNAQLTLPGFGPTPPARPPTGFGRHNFYFALRPDVAASAAAMGVSATLRCMGRLAKAIKRENLHVSLFPFWSGNEAPFDATEVASGYMQTIRCAPFDLEFDMAMSFRGGTGYAVVLGAAQGISPLYGLRRQFVRRFEKVIRAGSFTPHMTLFYSDRLVEKQPVMRVSWTAREILLIHSFVGQARQEVVARWPLR